MNYYEKRSKFIKSNKYNYSNYYYAIIINFTNLLESYKNIVKEKSEFKIISY